MPIKADFYWGAIVYNVLDLRHLKARCRHLTICLANANLFRDVGKTEMPAAASKVNSVAGLGISNRGFCINIPLCERQIIWGSSIIGSQ
jgi:hypothetical protein